MRTKPATRGVPKPRHKVWALRRDGLSRCRPSGSISCAAMAVLVVAFLLTWSDGAQRKACPPGARVAQRRTAWCRRHKSIAPGYECGVRMLPYFAPRVTIKRKVCPAPSKTSGGQTGRSGSPTSTRSQSAPDSRDCICSTSCAMRWGSRRGSWRPLTASAGRGTGTATRARASDTSSRIYCHSFDEGLRQRWQWSERYPG